MIILDGDGEASLSVSSDGGEGPSGVGLAQLEVGQGRQAEEEDMGKDEPLNCKTAKKHAEALVKLYHSYLPQNLHAHTPQPACTYIYSGLPLIRPPLGPVKVS